LNDNPNAIVGDTERHLFWFFVDEVGWPVMQCKLSLTNALWSLKNDPTIQLWKEDGIGRPKMLRRVLNLVLLLLIWGNDELKASEKERFINSGILKYIEFWRLGMAKANSYSKKNILGTIFKIYPMVEFCWKAFGLLTIGGLIMNAHPFLSLLMLTLEILSSLYIMGLEMCAFL
jgi:hypothetical protein